jgi:hypothetical protein
MPHGTWVGGTLHFIMTVILFSIHSDINDYFKMQRITELDTLA